jgi:hypothetical protein
MPLYLIKKKITTYLTVDCDDINQAIAWSERIVATLEDDDGNSISLDAIDDFEASANPDEITIELLDEE